MNVFTSSSSFSSMFEKKKFLFLVTLLFIILDILFVWFCFDFTVLHVQIQVTESSCQVVEKF